MFFDLPRELRDHIYDHLLDGVKVTFSDREIRPGRGARFSLFYRQSNDVATHPKLSPGILASKQMLEEALEQLYRNASCSATARCDCNKFERLGSGCKCYPGNLISISRVQNFDGPVQAFPTDCESLYKLADIKKPDFKTPARSPSSGMSLQTIVHGVCTRDEESDIFPAPFFNYLLDHPDHPAKQIKFSVSTMRMSSNDSLPPRPVDLSYFWRLGPRFNRVVMRADCPHVPADRAPWTRLRAHAIMFKRLQLELARTAVILVGGSDTAGYSVRDYMENGVEKGSLEWHVEAKRLPSEQSICIRHEGLRFFKQLIWTPVRSEYDYYKMLSAEEGDENPENPDAYVFWYCKSTGEALSMTLPLDKAAGRCMQEVDGLKNVSKALETAFYTKEG